jgi:glycosyltransferase involved in cell wall biosynthesis
VQSAARVITPSEFSKRRILDAYHLDEDKVVVLPYGVSSAFRPMPREAAQKWVQTSFGLRSPFVLTVGDLVPRKNHVGLIGAFEKLVRAYPQLPHQLVIVGKENWGASLIRAAAKHSRVADRIHFTGFVSDEGLLRLYGACDLFAYPSFYEGFGLPILEAMACGRAVACSNSSAIPEVADSAALLFHPDSEDEIALALRDLLLNAELRQRMERLGMQRAATYSWENTAGKTLDLYYAVAGEHSRTAAPAMRTISAGR